MTAAGSPGMISRDNYGGSVLDGTDSGVAAIGARFGMGAALAAGTGADAGEVAGALGMGRSRCRRPYFPFQLPNGLLTATTVGSALDIPMNFGPRTGYLWDVTMLDLSGFTAGAVSVSKNGFDEIAVFSSAGPQHFPQKGEPLLDCTERLVFTVTSAITGAVRVGGSVIMVPAERIDEYLG